jgi:NagD protein
LFFTNSAVSTPLELSYKLLRMGIEADPSHFYTSALSTASFLSSQSPGCSAYVIGGTGLINALYDVGVAMNDVNPDYVIVGETHNYNYECLEKAIQAAGNKLRPVRPRGGRNRPRHQSVDRAH